MASPWTVSTRRTGDRWAVYYEGRLVVDGYERASEATWAVTFLARGKVPPYVPDGAEVAWPWREARAVDQRGSRLDSRERPSSQ